MVELTAPRPRSGAYRDAEIALEHERRQQRVPENVADQNLGFDIRSRDPNTAEIRYIEVKARSTTAGWWL